MDSTAAWKVAIPIALLGTLILLALGVWVRRCRGDTNRFGHSYDSVNHELDDEEIEFKNMLENRIDFDANDIDDDIFNDTDTSALDSQDKDTLSMLANRINSTGSSPIGQTAGQTGQTGQTAGQTGQTGQTG
eukprot:CAMPEP_0173184520 /NCGR_PEP_ID=MMETSP1141-20130122/9019_1 /TAXON_ID=483371 /ORGANISM="non described non described, Strain CCMP2298" /LENGTH=131 /DNA_ID=CAMNT_0014107895 /DNA_START=105 /DNA_END=501 /DNA_ORIENTATION=+